MNFSSSIMSSAGISLGGLEIATDFLFANSEFYEPELTEIKSTISKKPVKVTQNIRPVKPKISKDSIINKFAIITKKPSVLEDEVIGNDTVLQASDDFDFSFDDENQEDIEATRVQNLLTKANTGDNMDNYFETEDEFDIDDLEDNDMNFEDSELDIEEDELDTEDTDNPDDLELDIEDSIDNIEIDDMESEEDIDSAIDDIDIAEDEEDDTFNMNGNDEEADDDSFSLEDLDSEDESDTQEKTEQNEEDSLLDSIDNIGDDDIEEDNENDSLLDSIDNLGDDIEEDAENDSTSTMFKDTSDETEEDSFSIDDLDTEEDEPVINKTEQKEVGDEQEEIVSEPKQVEVHTQESEDIKQLKQQLAELQKQMQEKKKDDTLVNACDVKDTVLKNSDEQAMKDLAVHKETNKTHRELKYNKNIKAGLYEEYTNMSIEKLYIIVYNYMLKMGVKKRPVDISALNSKFGEINIKKLIQKSYLIKIGKGVTTGQ